MTRYLLKIREGSTFKEPGDVPWETCKQVVHPVTIPVEVAPEHEELMDSLLKVWNEASAKKENSGERGLPSHRT